MQPCPAPPRFTPAGAVRVAELSLHKPPFIAPPRTRGSKAAGVRYERRAQSVLQDRYGDLYVRSPWFHFLSTTWRWCQPDGLLVDIARGKITIIEIKLKHTSDAWWQTRRLYEPVVKKVFPPSIWSYAVAEVVRWYDGDVAFPEHFTFVPDPRHVPVGSLGIHILR